MQLSVSKSQTYRDPRVSQGRKSHVSRPASFAKQIEVIDMRKIPSQTTPIIFPDRIDMNVPNASDDYHCKLGICSLSLNLRRKRIRQFDFSVTHECWCFQDSYQSRFFVPGKI